MAADIDFQTPFAALVHARELAHYVRNESLLAVFASSDIKVFPYQIAAARFAATTYGQKGAVLCDEGSLGKTYEALLIAAQKWLTGRNRILIVLPPNLVSQWQTHIEKDFTLPTIIWRSGTLPDEEGLILTTYDCAIKNADQVARVHWDMAIFDEADALFKPTNKSVQILKEALPNVFKLLLTPTPITMSIMDVYGLLHFIDETILPPEDEFYKRYFRKPENYPELAQFVSLYCFRTLKKQVAQYVGFSRRIPITLDYHLTDAEQKLYAQADQYLKRTVKTAYPSMDLYELNLLFYHTLSSSPRAFAAMLPAAISRTTGEEQAQLKALQTAAQDIDKPAKFVLLARVLKQVFSHLRTQKLPRKVLIFVNNSTTQKELESFLNQAKYKVLLYKGENSIYKFRKDESEILVTLDAAAKGLDIEFCPVVVNYDLLYNAVELEQRICRCHRQGQQADVLVINLLSKENLADVRILELINKRTLQFDGIFGSSDDIVGDFAADIAPSLAQMRPVKQTAQEIEQTLTTHRAENEAIVSAAQAALFTTFSKAIADKITITPQYIKEKSADLNQELWRVVRYFILHHPNRACYEINDTDQTLTLVSTEAPVLFYYHSGGRNKQYIGKTKYGAKEGFKPAAGRITFTSLLGKGVLAEMPTPDKGTLLVPDAPYNATIGLFNVDVVINGDYVYEEDILIGQTQDGKTLSHAECLSLLDLPVTQCQADNFSSPYWLKGMTGKEFDSRLEKLIDKPALLERYYKTKDQDLSKRAEQLKLEAERKKVILEKSLYNLKTEADEARRQLADCADQWKALKLQKKLSVAKRDLLKAQEELFVKRMKIDTQLEEELSKLKPTAKAEFKVRPIFVVNIHREQIWVQKK